MPPARSAATDPALLGLRLAAQLLGEHDLGTPAAVVAWMGAVQAQDFGASRWAVGVRLPGSTEAQIAAALSSGAVLRTHLFRGTWQLVTPEDVRWMLELVGPRVLTARAGRERRLGLDAATFRRSRRILERTLADGPRTRDELAAALDAGGVSAEGIRLAHLLQRVELEGVICSGALRGRTPTFALLDACAPPAPRALRRDEALRELAIRHARGRGPVTAADLAWWSGLPLREARAGLEAARPELAAERIGGVPHWRAEAGPGPARPGAAWLLPAFDEYLVGYRERGAALAAEHVRRVNDGGGMLAPCVVVAGRVLGVWRRSGPARAPELEVTPFQRLPAPAGRSLQAAARRYAEYLVAPARLSTGEAPREEPRGGRRARSALRP